MEVLKTLFCSQKFPWAGETISLKSIDNLGQASWKSFTSPAFTITCPLLFLSCKGTTKVCDNLFTSSWVYPCWKRERQVKWFQ